MLEIIDRKRLLEITGDYCRLLQNTRGIQIHAVLMGGGLKIISVKLFKTYFWPGKAKNLLIYV